MDSKILVSKGIADINQTTALTSDFMAIVPGLIMYAAAQFWSLVDKHKANKVEG